MMTISVKADFKPFKALLDGFSERRHSTTIAIALTKTAQIAQKEVISEIRTAFDRPTRWALNSTRLVSATKDKLVAHVWLKDRKGEAASNPAAYMYPQVLGGRRDRKAYETALLRAGVLRSNEFTVPAGDFALDAYGNVPVGVIRQILSQLKAAETSAGYTANKTASVRSRRAVSKAGTYFVPRPGSGLPRGIYKRKRVGAQWQTRMVLKIVVGKPHYQQRLRLFAIAQRVADRELQRQYDLAYERSLARLQARNAAQSR